MKTIVALLHCSSWCYHSEFICPLMNFMLMRKVGQFPSFSPQWVKNSWNVKLNTIDGGESSILWSTFILSLFSYFFIPHYVWMFFFYVGSEYCNKFFKSNIIHVLTKIYVWDNLRLNWIVDILRKLQNVILT